MAHSFERPSIDEQDVAEPERGEGKRLPRLEPCEPIPCQNPRQCGQYSAEPSPPRKRTRRRPVLRIREAFLEDSPQWGREDDKRAYCDDNEHCEDNKYRPGERWMFDVAGLGRELQVAMNRLSGDNNA